jgi:hypothetical protein
LEEKKPINFWKVIAVILTFVVIGTNANVQAQVASTGYVISRFLDSGGSIIVNAGDTANNALRVNVVAGGGGGTQYTEDVAQGAGGESVTLAGAIRADATSSTQSANGDYSNLKTDVNGRLWVNGSEVTQPVSGTVTATTAPTTTASANNDGACVSMTTTSATILASFGSRKYASICALGATTENTDTVHIKLGATASASDFPLRPGACWNTPAGSIYTGVIDGRANSGTQSVCVLEW